MVRTFKAPQTKIDSATTFEEIIQEAREVPGWLIQEGENLDILKITDLKVYYLSRLFWMVMSLFIFLLKQINLVLKQNSVSW